MRAAIVAIMLICVSASAEQYIYVRDGKVASAPRALPSVGVRQDTGTAVLGLHGASDATRAACGWYRVVPSSQKVADAQRVVARNYVIGKGTAQEVLTIADRVIRTPQQRISNVLDAMPGATDDERVSALIRAVAVAVTGRLDKAVTVTIPARMEAAAR